MGWLDGLAVPFVVNQYIPLEYVYEWHEAVHGVYVFFYFLQHVDGPRVCRMCPPLESSSALVVAISR